MSVGFGFSTGDFIAGLRLVREIIRALDDSVGSSAEYRSLLDELQTLRRTLEILEHLKIPEWQRAQHIALEQIAVQSWRTIENFMGSTTKFKSALGAADGVPGKGMSTRLRAGLRKTQWALSKRKDVSRVKGDIMRHTSAMNTLLSTIHHGMSAHQSNQIQALQGDSTKSQQQADNLQALVSQNAELLKENARLLRSQNRQLQVLEKECVETKSLLPNFLGALERFFNFVLALQCIFWTFPRQLSFQQPVYLEDFLGRITPFHIEWVDTRKVSLEIAQKLVHSIVKLELALQMFEKSLEVRFRHLPGWRSVKRREYSIQDSKTNQDIDLSLPWHLVFRPGRKVFMSVSLLQRSWKTWTDACPRCQSVKQGQLHKSFADIVQEIGSNTLLTQWYAFKTCLSEPELIDVSSNKTCGLWYSQRVVDPDATNPRHGSKTIVNQESKDKSNISAIRGNTPRNDQKRGERSIRDESSTVPSNKASRSKKGRKRAKKTMLATDEEIQYFHRVRILRPITPRYVAAVSGNFRRAAKARQPENVFRNPDSSRLIFDDDDKFISLDDSCTKYIFENGRRYHAYKPDKYWQPNDEAAADHLDLGHCLYRMLMDDKLYLAPINYQPQKVLDIGTGTGIWAFDFADAFPKCQIRGLDLSPIQPQLVPPNLHFILDDLDDFDYHSQCDFIHLRGLFGCSRNWPAFYQAAKECLVPGGWIQQAEISFTLISDDLSLPHNHVLREWSHLLTEMGERFGSSLRTSESMEGDIKQAGFDEVTTKVLKCPLGTWSMDLHQKRLGTLNLLYWLGGIEGWCLALLSRVGEWSLDRINTFLDRVRTGLKDPSVHVYHEVTVVYGRKPI